MKYWLLKTEPSVFSWDDLQRLPHQTTSWEGVRNYQARNLMRDEMKQGDLAFFYHSAVKQPAIMGIVQVVREAYPDPFAWDATSPYYDPKSSSASPRWVAVDVQFKLAFATPILLEDLKRMPSLEGMLLLQKGCRLSVQPVTEPQWQYICELGSPVSRV